MLQDNLFCCKTGLLRLRPTQELQFDAELIRNSIFLWKCFFSPQIVTILYKKTFHQDFVSILLGFFNADKNHIAFPLFQDGCH